MIAVRARLRVLAALGVSEEAVVGNRDTIQPGYSSELSLPFFLIPASKRIQIIMFGRIVKSSGRISAVAPTLRRTAAGSTAQSKEFG